MISKTCRIKFAATIVMSVLCLGVTLSTHAQQVEQATTPATPVIQNKTEWRSMRVRNVRPGIIAWLIDPKNNPEPAEFRVARSNGAVTDSPTTVSAFPEIDGIQAIKAIDAQNMISAYGSESGWQKLQSYVQLLDQPIKVIEIEIHEVEIREEILRSFGWQTGVQEPTAILKISTQKFEKALDSLTQNGRAKVINSPRVTAMNNFPATLGHAKLGPAAVTVDTGVAPATGHEFATVTYPNSQFMLKRNPRVTVTPTVNNDESITLLLNLAEPVYLVRASQKDIQERLRNPNNDPLNPQELPELLLDKGDKFTSIVNMYSDETITVGGWNTKLTDDSVAEPEKNPAYRMIFVSARLVR